MGAVHTPFCMMMHALACYTRHIMSAGTGSLATAFVNTYMICKFSDYVFYTRVSRYDEAEVTLDEMKTGTSAYMKEDKIKQKFIATWNHLCQVVGVPSEVETTESDEDVSSGYNKTAYPEINRRVMRLLRLNKFPDHFDIVELIERCSAKHQLGISTTEKAQMSKKNFRDVGKLLKMRRAKDFKAHIGCHLTDDALLRNEDPATSDSALLKILEKSLKEGREKLDKIFEDFVVKQERQQGRKCKQDRSTEDDPRESDTDSGEEEGESEETEGDDIIVEDEDERRVINDED